MMKRILLILLCIISLNGFAQNLLNEDFNYTIGSSLTANGWTAHSGGTTQPIDVVSGLTFSGYLASGIGGAANLDNTGQDVNITFTQQTSGVIYASFIVQTQSSNSAGYFFHLGQNSIGSTFFTRVWVNASGDGIGLGSSAPSTYKTITVDTPTLVVVKYDISSKVSSLFVFNTFPTLEPVVADATFTETVTPSNVGSVALRQYNASQKIIVDGIRVGLTWGDAVTASNSSSASISTVANLNSFNYFTGSGPSDSQSFTVSGDNLIPTSGNLTVLAPSDFEVSLNGSDYFTSVLLPYTSGGVILNNTVHVRLIQGLVSNAYLGTLTISGGDASDYNLNLNGLVADPFLIPYQNSLATQTDVDAATALGFAFNNAILTTAAGGYIKMSLNSFIETPVINFSLYSTLLLNFDMTTFGGSNGQEVSVLISNDNGISYTSLKTLTVSDSYETFVVGVDLSSNSNVNGKIKFEMTNGTSSTRFRSLSIDKEITIWNGVEWSNTVGPSSTIEAIIEGAYTTTTNQVLAAKKITINSGSLTISPNSTVEIQNELINNLTAAAVVVESNGNLRQYNNVANTGEITVRRNSADMVRLDYTNWSSPVVGQNALAFSPATVATRFYSYDPLGTTAAGTTGSYSVIDPSTTSFTAGNGLLVRAPNNWSSTIASAYPGEFTGVPHNGNYSVSIANNPANTTSVPANIGFNLLGNPYASPIDADAYLAANTGAGVTALYFWTHTEAANASGNYATSNYASFNSLGGAAAAAGGLTPDGIIQVGQGFLANTNTGGTAVFNNGMRLASSNGQFFKTSGQLNQATTVEKHRMWFDLNSPGNNHNQILVGYIQGATNGLDASFDANLFTETSSALYSSLSNGKFVIQGRALPFVSSDSVPLGLLAQTAGQYTITLSNFDGLFSGQDVYLRDNLLNVTHDIKDSAYTFASAAGEFDSRFEIVYAAPLSVQTPTFTENSVVVYSDQSGININAGQTVIDNVKIFDVRGRQLMSKSNINESSILLENSIANNQVLIIQISTLDNQTISKKIVN